MIRARSLLFAAAITFPLAACGDDSTPDPDPDPDPQGEASLRVVHASPDAPAVDIYAEGVAEPLITELAYGETSAYLDLVPGEYNIQIRAAGAAADSAPVFETGDLTIPDGATITALAAGFLAGTAADDQFRVIPLVEDFDAVASGTARVRIVHASPDAPTVAIDVGNDGTPEVAALARFADTGAAGVELPAGEAIQVGIWAGDPLARVTAFTTPELPAGAELFVIATGSLAPKPRAEDGFGLLAVAPTGSIGIIRQNPVVFALHGSPDAPAVDVFAGTAELIDDLAFTELSGGLQVPPGAYTLDFFAHAAGSARPAGDPAASATTPALAAGERYLAIATGFLSGTPSFRLLPLADEFEREGTEARVRFVHASPDAPAVDVGTMAENTLTPVWSSVAFESSSAGAGTAVPSATLELGAGLPGAGTAVATFTVTTVDNLDAFAVAVGSLGAGTLRLVIVNATTGAWTASTVLPD